MVFIFESRTGVAELQSWSARSGLVFFYGIYSNNIFIFYFVLFFVSRKERLVLSNTDLANYFWKWGLHTYYWRRRHHSWHWQAKEIFENYTP